MKIKKKHVFLPIIGAIAVGVCTIGVCEWIVISNANGRTFSNVEDIPQREVGIVLGTSPVSTWTGRRNIYFDKRIEAATDLYKAGKVKRLIVSGGDYRNSEANGYDEPVAMRDSLIKNGIPAKDIILDYDGTCTLNSISKAKTVYNLDKITLISQKYHNERALYQAKYVGIDALAFNAKTPSYRKSWLRNRGRECLARVKLFVDIIRGVKPDIRETAVKELEQTGDSLLYVDNISTRHGDLLCIRPDMSKLSMDLVCGMVPNVENDSIALAFAGAFTGTLHGRGHNNIAGDHVSGGKLYKGYKCKRNTGAFTWSEASGPKFHYRDYAPALKKASDEGGMAFTQEMMIHEGVAVDTTRPFNNKNQFRALCMMSDDRIAILESRGTAKFGDFINALLDAGATEAIYTDMGPGWNYCFYRQQAGQAPSFLHSHPLTSASNFIVVKQK